MKNKLAVRLMKPWMLSLLFLGAFLSGTANAMHVGAYLGPSIFTNNPPDKGSSTVLFSGGFDVAASLIPAFDFGGYYFRTMSEYRTLIGVEANFYPLISNVFYMGGKFGNSNLANDNHIVYAPVVGFNYDLAPTLSVGIDGSYFFYNGLDFKDINLLGNIKIWL